MPWPQTGATHYHAQLGLPVKGRAIKGLVVCNNSDLKPLDLQNSLAPGCYQLSPDVFIVILLETLYFLFIRMCQRNIFINCVGILLCNLDVSAKCSFITFIDKLTIKVHCNAIANFFAQNLFYCL